MGGKPFGTTPTDSETDRGALFRIRARMLTRMRWKRCDIRWEVSQKENDMKWFFIGLFVAVGILDVLLILGCAKLERMREEREKRDERKRQISNR